MSWLGLISGPSESHEGQYLENRDYTSGDPLRWLNLLEIPERRVLQQVPGRRRRRGP